MARVLLPRRLRRSEIMSKQFRDPRLQAIYEEYCFLLRQGYAREEALRIAQATVARTNKEAQ